MKELQGVKDLEKAVNLFLDEFDLYGELGTDFCYEYMLDKVTFSLVVSKTSDEYFQEFIKKTWNDVNVDTFFVSLLHEVGHSETYDELEDMDIAYANDIKDMIDKELAEGCSETRKKELYFEYFNLPDEYAATEWAINYIKDNSVECAAAYNIISKAIEKFFILNDVI